MSSPIDTSSATAPATLEALALEPEQPGWRVLDTARAQRFTGEISFDVEPKISVYFDEGRAYHAVQAGDPSLCDRLAEVGVLEPAQIERGVIRVGDVENLGRLFDRDPSVDRDAVMVVLELATDDVVTAIANTVTSSFDPTAYRHHVSGVHRWFVAPVEQHRTASAQPTPVGEAVAQADTVVTDSRPALPDTADDEVHIEWDQPLDDDALDAPTPLHTFDDSMLESLFNGTDTTEATDAADRAPAPELNGHTTGKLNGFAPPALSDETPADGNDLSALFETLPSAPGRDEVERPAPPSEHFQIVWPDGTGQALLGPDADSGAPVPTAVETDTDTVADVVADVEVADAVAPHQSETTPDMPTVDVPADAPFEDMAPSEPELQAPVDVVPVDIAPDDIVPIDIAPDDAVLDDAAAADLAPADVTPADALSEPVPTSAPESPAQTFELPPLAIADDNLPDAHQPEEVVDAVRRALEAIESALAAPATLPTVSMADLPSFEPTEPLEVDVVDPLALDSDDPARDAAPNTDAVADTIDVPVVEVAALEASLPSHDSANSIAASTSVAEEVTPITVVDEPAPVAAAPTGFAPPTMHDSAEAVYARAAAAETASAGPASGVASVVFVDEEPVSRDDRSGSLRRLIGSLRRK